MIAVPEGDAACIQIGHLPAATRQVGGEAVCQQFPRKRLPSHSATWSFLGSLSHPPLQAAIFPLKLFQLPNLVDLQGDVLFFPSVEGLLGDSCCRHSSTGTPTSACFRMATICSTEKRFRFMANLPPLAGQILAETNSHCVSENGADHAGSQRSRACL